MALKSTIFKAEVQIADMDRHYYERHALTIARHPSETNERMMMRVLAFILNASEYLSFANGLSASDEPDLWEKDLTGAIVNWIMVGLPDEKLIKRAKGRSTKVIIYSYGGSSADLWWAALNHNVTENVQVVNVAQEFSTALANFAERAMSLQATIQDGILWISCDGATLEINLQALKKSF